MATGAPSTCLRSSRRWARSTYAPSNCANAMSKSTRNSNACTSTTTSQPRAKSGGRVRSCQLPLHRKRRRGHGSGVRSCQLPLHREPKFLARNIAGFSAGIQAQDILRNGSGRLRMFRSPMTLSGDFIATCPARRGSFAQRRCVAVYEAFVGCLDAPAGMRTLRLRGRWLAG